MAWQDELKDLDDDLSSGRITAEEHRRRRDEILATASSNPVGLRRRLQKQQTTSIANAFGGGEPGTPNAATLPTVTRGTAGRQGQVRPAPQGAGPVPEAPARPVPPGPAAPASSWQPTVLPAPRPDQVRPKQGEEVFDAAADGRPRWIWLVAIVVVLALTGGGLWWFTSGSSGTPAPTVPPPAAEGITLDSVPNPTDLPLSTSGVLTVDQAQIYNLLKPEEAGYLGNATERIYYRGVSAGNLVYHVFAFRTRDPNGARALATSIVEHNRQAGLTDAAVPGLPAGVQAMAVVSANAAIYEAVYPSDGVAVRVMVVQNGPADESLLADTLKRSVDITASSIAPR